MARMSVVAHTALGALRGVAEAGVTVFRGVPYAEPPTGERRFAKPVPVAAWNDVRDASEHGPIAPQPPSRLRLAMGDFERPQDEDCLTLTIATPAVDDAARAVVVWLHGGAYLSGAGSLDWYDGSLLARDGDVVFVGVNYRLGALGFLRHEALGCANNALHDMIAALAWVRDNISAFGGDPARVTLMGQSAGAHAIMCLLGMPETRGLFHRAILQSTPPSLVPLSRTTAQDYADRLVAALGIPVDATDVAARLRDAPADQLVTAQMRVARDIARFADISPPFVPVFDGFASARDFVAMAARAARTEGIDIVIGTTREEMHAFFAPDPAMKNPDPRAVADRFTELAGDAAALDAYRVRRSGASVMDALADLVTDHMFLFPSLALAEAIADSGGRPFVYEFDWAPPGNRFKACHCIELPFVFGVFPAYATAEMLAGGDSAPMQALSSTIRAAWSSFARDGKPVAGALPWSAYDTHARTTMLFGTVCGQVGDPACVVTRHGYERWRLPR
jgi:para-nitrobenzyl esterase